MDPVEIAGVAAGHAPRAVLLALPRGPRPVPAPSSRRPGRRTGLVRRPCRAPDPPARSGPSSPTAVYWRNRLRGRIVHCALVPAVETRAGSRRARGQHQPGHHLVRLRLVVALRVRAVRRQAQRQRRGPRRALAGLARVPGGLTVQRPGSRTRGTFRCSGGSLPAHARTRSSCRPSPAAGRAGPARPLSEARRALTSAASSRRIRLCASSRLLGR